MDRKKFRVWIKHCFLMGKNTVAAKQWLDKHNGDSASEKLQLLFTVMLNLNAVVQAPIMLNARVTQNRQVTIGETWIQHYTLESKRSSAEWTAAGESRPKRPKSQKSVGKIMASVFLDVHGIFFIDYFKKGKTINSEYYMALLDRLSAEIKKKWSHMQKKKAVSPGQCPIS